MDMVVMDGDEGHGMDSVRNKKSPGPFGLRGLCSKGLLRLDSLSGHPMGDMVAGVMAGSEGQGSTVLKRVQHGDLGFVKLG